ncbi:TlpA disulfide reductase family protein [Mucilaginibacter phyllosphaerae]|uniref:AhpC/TSA family protein n=1 Tax=Mucilaginibacter phyllosphaerae TaxID=1812349 RepID=A0A4Y8ACS8_9SPHI|nr:TlpA disulfide reductase family protein [Mucilaginibacter phyllosphaerae]MBB3970055.1 peroxiredoxin [Mucilaginibacter phyllosphaerae]TEW66447.1 AhpC/TSA family protein [Mucilaginibacter phyllosphaerae]GGH09463.1 thiol:disulfide interchange protein [Mucilaginibacter phyllosphaerae]
MNTFKFLKGFILALAPLISLAQVNNTYTLQGKAGKPATVTLQYTQNGKTVQNKAEVQNGEIMLTGTIDTPLQASLLVTPSEKEAMATIVHLWLEPGQIKLNSLDSLQKGNGVFSGTPLNDESNALALEKDKVTGLSDQAHDEAVKAIVVKFIKAHPASLLSLTELNITLSRGIPDLAIVEPLFSGLSAGLKNSPLGVEYQKKLIRWRTVDVGAIAPNFTQPDQQGKLINLADYKGKYVLVDFWASWCHPCRDENPNLVKQYQLYKDKNFTILSISLDESKTAWLKAIKEDKLPWKQVSDLKKNNQARVKYGVQSIPDNFLISPEGEIIGKSLRGEDLNKKLMEVLGK